MLGDTDVNSHDRLELQVGNCHWSCKWNEYTAPQEHIPQYVPLHCQQYNNKKFVVGDLRADNILLATPTYPLVADFGEPHDTHTHIQLSISY